MFERFTDRARRVLVLAQEEARSLNHNLIGTEHLLLGLMHEGDGVAAKALSGLGVKLEEVREAVEENRGATRGPITGSPPFTPRAKKVLELSLREALRLDHSYIGTEHLLLGLLREGEGVGVQILGQLGVPPARVRKRVMSLLEGQPPEEPADRGPGPPMGVREGPRCPTCRELLAANVAYRVLPVPLADAQDPSATTDLGFVYCRLCGVVVPHVPTGPDPAQPGAT